MTLREAIEQLVNLGEKDPHRIAEQLRKNHEPDWLAAELLALADDVIADLARSVISSSRRSSLSLARVGGLPKRELMLQAAWLPGIGWLEFGKFTADDFDKLAAVYRKGASALNRYAEWCESSAALIRAEGVKTFAKVHGELRLQHQLRRMAFERDNGFALPPDAVQESLGRADARKHADALRIVAKDFLLQLWLASRQSQFDARRESAGGDS